MQTRGHQSGALGRILRAAAALVASLGFVHLAAGGASPASAGQPQMLSADDSAGAPCDLEHRFAKHGASSPATPKASDLDFSVDDGTLDVLILGDSLGDGLWLGLQAHLAHRNDVELHRHAKPATGLVRLDYFDWLSEVRKFDGEEFDVAIVVFGANDRQPIPVEEGGHLPFMSDAWRQEYVSRIDAFTKSLTESGMRVFWIGMPMMESDSFSKKLSKLNDLYRSRAVKNGIQYVSTWERVADDEGEFKSHVTVGDGTRRRIRLDDGVHFTTYGYRYLVAPLVERYLKGFDASSGGEERANRGKRSEDS